MNVWVGLGASSLIRLILWATVLAFVAGVGVGCHFDASAPSTAVGWSRPAPDAPTVISPDARIVDLVR